MLMTGTTVAQAIPVAISPLLTRMYSPESFGVLTLFISVVALVSAISNLRFHLAIVQPGDDEDALSLVVLSIMVAVFISLGTLVSVHVWNQDIRVFLGNESVGPWLYFAPLSVLFFGLYQPLNYWLTRKESFKPVASSKVVQGLTMGAAQVAFGALGHGPLGLIFGYVLGQLSAFSTLMKRCSFNRQVIKNVSPQLVLENGVRYKRMPLYSAPGALLNSATVQLPNFFIVRYFDLIATGFFGLVLRVLNLPLALISGAVGQVALQRLAAYENAHGQERLARAFVLKLALILLLAISPFAFLIIGYGDVLFGFFFGEAWSIAGDMAGILVVAVTVRFVVSPLSLVMALERHVRTGVAWQALYFCTLFSTLTYFSDLPLTAFLKVYVVHELVLYFLYFLLILRSLSQQN